MPVLAAIGGVAVGAAKGAVKALGIPTGGVPLTRYGKYLSQLAQRRGQSIEQADRWARELEKQIDDGEDKLSFTVTGPEGSEVERMWASRVISATSQLNPALSAAEWAGFASTDRAGNAYRRGLIPPKGSAGSLGVPIGLSPVHPSQQGGTDAGGYTLPVQQVTAPNLLWIVLGGAVLLGAVVFSKK